MKRRKQFNTTKQIFFSSVHLTLCFLAMIRKPVTRTHDCNRYLFRFFFIVFLLHSFLIDVIGEFESTKGTRRLLLLRIDYVGTYIFFLFLLSFEAILQIFDILIWQYEKSFSFYSFFFNFPYFSCLCCGAKLPKHFGLITFFASLFEQ